VVKGAEVNDVNELLLGILIPFIGTTTGAACVFPMKKEMDERLQRILTGFAAGVMMAASVWSLLIPSLENAVSSGVFRADGCGCEPCTPVW